MREYKRRSSRSVTVMFFLSAYHCEDEDSSDSDSGPMLISIRGITLEAGVVLLGKHWITIIAEW